MKTRATETSPEVSIDPTNLLGFDQLSRISSPSQPDAGRLARLTGIGRLLSKVGTDENARIRIPPNNGL